MRYKVKLHPLLPRLTIEDQPRRKVKHVDAAGFYISYGTLVFHGEDDSKAFFAVAADDWYQVSVVA